MEFVDREAELEVLKKANKRTGSSLVTIYGRRRLGKTELITRFIKSASNGVYYLATKEDSTVQLKSLSSLVGIQIKDQELSRFGAVDWEALFLRIRNRQTKGKLIIAIDEFPYLAHSNNAISSIFQKGWDQYLKDANVVLILCGSSISMMHSQVLDYSAPLYQRSTSILEMRPLPINASFLLTPNMKFEDKLYTYFIFGGVPAYYSFTEKSMSINDIIYDIFSPGSVFLDEPSTILSEETTNEARYIDILELISNGINHTNEIASKTKIRPSNVTRYLDVLERIGIVKKVFPITEGQSRRSKRGVYEIQDNYLRFWFRYIKRNRDLLNTAGDKAVEDKVIKELSLIGGGTFEKFAMDFVRSLRRKGFPQLLSIGKWWGRNPNKKAGLNEEEIDLVAINDVSKDILFGECKWTNSKVDVDVYRQLKEKAKLVKWNENNRKEHFILFSKSGFTDKLIDLAEKEGVMLFDLNAIEKVLV